MELKTLFDDDRAVSPVIGVILMVAITVILAAVIGSFVLGLGNSVQETAPNANFDFDYNSTNFSVTATHTGGDTIPGTDSLVLTSGSSNNTSFATPVSAGDSVIVGTGSGETVRVTWTSQNGETSQVLASDTAP